MRRLLGIILGAILFFGVIFFFGGKQLINILSNSNLGYFFIALLTQFFIIFLYVARLKIIISAQKYKLRFFRIFKILVSGMAINQLTPIIKAGGEPVKLYYLAKSNIPATKSSASIVVEITSELISFYVTLFLLIIFLSVTKYLTAKFLYIGTIIFCFVIIGFFFAFRFMLDKDKIEKFIEKYVLRFFKANAKISSKIFSSSLRNLFLNKSLCIKIFSISFLCRLLEFFRIYFIFLAINFPVPITLVLVVWVLEVLFSTVPWLPGGLGLVEGGIISTLIIFGIPAPFSSSMLLLDRFLSLWLIVIIGLIGFYFLNKEIKSSYR